MDNAASPLSPHYTGTSAQVLEPLLPSRGAGTLASHETLYDNDDKPLYAAREDNDEMLDEGIENAVKTAEDEDSGVVDVAAHIPDRDRESEKLLSWKLLWAYTGPGWLMSIAYLDPGNLESDLQAGAYGGYQLLWVLFWSTIIGLFVQVLAARLGVVSGLSLAQHCRKHYRRPLRLFLWAMIEIAIIASDIQEVLGSAIAITILSNNAIPVWAGCIITGLDTMTFLGIHHFGVRKLEAVFGSLVAIMLVCFGAQFAAIKPDGSSIAAGTVLPLLNRYSSVQAVGILGAVVMPHNFYLHSALVKSRKVDRRNNSRVSEACKYNAIESGFALFTSFIINAMVLVVFAKSFFSPGCQQSCGTAAGCTALWADGTGGTATCRAIGLEEAGSALQSVLGSSAGKTIWAVGLLAAGQASTMTGTYAGQFVMEGFLQLEIPNWIRVAVTRLVALGPAVIVALASQSEAGAADRLDEWLNVLQSLLLPYAVLPLLNFTQSHKVMRAFANDKMVNFFAWTISAVIVATNVYLAVDSLAGLMSTSALLFTILVGGLFYLYSMVLLVDSVRKAVKLRLPGRLAELI